MTQWGWSVEQEICIAGRRRTTVLEGELILDPPRPRTRCTQSSDPQKLKAHEHHSTEV